MNQDQRMAGFVLFLLGGLTGTFLASRWARRPPGATTIEGLQSLLDETVEGVEGAASFVQSLVEPIRDLLDEAHSVGKGLRRTIDVYRRPAARGASFDYVREVARTGVSDLR